MGTQIELTRLCEYSSKSVEAAGVVCFCRIHYAGVDIILEQFKRAIGHRVPSIQAQRLSGIERLSLPLEVRTLRGMSPVNSNTVILRGTVVGEPWFIEDSATSHFLLALANPNPLTAPGAPDLCQVRCAGQLAGQVEAVIYHQDPVMVLGELSAQRPKRHDQAHPIILNINAETVGHDLAHTDKTPII